MELTDPEPTLRMAKIAIRSAAGLIILFSASLSHALEVFPFYTVNQSPLVQIYGLPAADNAILLPKGKIRSMLSVDIANNFGVDQNPQEQIVLDGESDRVMLGFRYGVAKGIEAGIDIPYLDNSGGFLDLIVQGFHSTFGITEGGRDCAPKDRLLFRYARNGVDQFRITNGNSGVGDIRLLGGVQLYNDEKAYPRALALRGSLKLPSGYSPELQGSGSTDFALWLTGSDDYPLGSGHFTLFGAAGGLAMSKGDVLPAQQRNLVAFGTGGFGWSPNQSLAIKAQANAHTSFYTDSHLIELNSGSVQLMIGATFALPAKILMDFAIIDDLILISSSPDIVYQLAFRKEF
jgi:Protein of unknown function (DUF3187)